MLPLAGGACSQAPVLRLLASNFIEVKNGRHLKRLQSLDNPRFMVELGVLFGAGGRERATEFTFETCAIGRAPSLERFAHSCTDRARLGHVCFGSNAYVRYRTYATSVDAYR